MDKLDPNKHGTSADLVEQNIAELKLIFPDAFTEGKVDFAALRELLGTYTDDSQERYSFTWSGKNRARRIAQTSSTGTLRPCPEESVNWDTADNLFIEGDNLEVLKLLQKSYHKRIKMIYIDPPYNTGKEFVYPDRYQDNLQTYLRYTGQVDDDGFKLSINAETSGRYHTNWLNMMYPRLKLARNLLRDDGVIFISIDDHELASLLVLCNEVFGEENFRATISWQKKYSVSNNMKGIASIVDKIVVYAKSPAFQNGLLARTEESKERYQNPDDDPRGPWKPVDYWNQAAPEERPNLCYSITNPNTGHVIYPTKKAWKYSPDVHMQHVADNRIYWGGDGTNTVPALKLFLSEVRDGMIPHNWWTHEDAGHTDEAKKELEKLFEGVAPFDTPKPTRLIRRMMQVAGVSASNGDVILDFFAGSASTAHAVLAENAADGGNRRFIMVQLPEQTGNDEYPTIAAIGKHRVRRVITQLSAQIAPTNDDSQSLPEIDMGFKALTLDSSNLKPWDADFDSLELSLLDALDSIKAGRSDVDVLYEVLLKYGLDIAVPVEGRNICGSSVHIIGAGALVVCLSDQIGLDVVSGIAALKKEFEPEVMRVVFRDAGFQDDVVKTNAVQILRQAGIDDVKSL